MNKIILVSLEGFLSDASHRTHLSKQKSWDAYYAGFSGDTIKLNSLDLLNQYNALEYKIFLYSNIPVKHLQEMQSFLASNDIPYTGIFMKESACSAVDHLDKVLARLEKDHPSSLSLLVVNTDTEVNHCNRLNLPCLQVGRHRAL